MSNIYVDKNKIDLLANAISAKSGEPLTLTLDEMVEAVDGIEGDGGRITPTGNIDITQIGVTDVTEYATATVSQSQYELVTDHYFETVNGVRKFKVRAELDDRYNGGFIFLSPYEAKLGAQTIFNAIGTGTSITPTESSQTIGGVNTPTMLEGVVTINAIPSNYVGSDVPQRSSSDLSVSGPMIEVPYGYYSSGAAANIDFGTEGTPTASKGTVSNHSISVTPSVTNTMGYITGGTHNGTAVSVSASELVSGTLSVTSSGTKDVTNYASASIPSGSATGPSTLSGTSATVSTGTNTLTLTKTGVTTTPTVSAGYVSAATASTATVTLTANVTTQAATTYHPSTSNQTIAGSRYLTGTQTINAVTTTNLSASNILNGVTIKVGDSSDDDCVASVTGNVVIQNYYTGSSAPSSSLGNDGDLYLQI